MPPLPPGQAPKKVQELEQVTTTFGYKRVPLSQEMVDKLKKAGQYIEPEYFENYEVTENDLEKLQTGIDTLVESGLIDIEVLNSVRYVTYDSKYFYVVTREMHECNGEYNVEELKSNSKTGFRVFKINIAGVGAKYYEDYRGASAGLLRSEIEDTAVNSTKYPDPWVSVNSPKYKNTLNVVGIAPFGPYSRIHNDTYTYLTDAIAHEAGHIEDFINRNWKHGDPMPKAFSSTEKEEIFMEIMRKSKLLPPALLNLILTTIAESPRIKIRSMGELYAMLPDREMARLYDMAHYDKENSIFNSKLVEISANPEDENVLRKHYPTERLESGHTIGRLLLRILENEFPNFDERKKFLKGILR